MKEYDDLLKNGSARVPAVGYGLWVACAGVFFSIDDQRRLRLRALIKDLLGK